MTKHTRIQPMKDWLHEADLDLLSGFSNTQAKGTYYVDNQFGIDLNVSSLEQDYREFLTCETAAEEEETVLDVVSRLNRLYLDSCTEQALHPRFMLCISSVEGDGRIVLEERFPLANGRPALLLRKRQGRARGTYKARNMIGHGADQSIEIFDVSVDAGPGETPFAVMYRLNKIYIEECRMRGLTPDEDLYIDSITQNKHVVIMK